MSKYSEDEVDSWVDAVNDFYDQVVSDPGDMRAAEHAAARLWSGNGFLGAPLHVLRALSKATQAGYAAALRDVREGRFDEELEVWRR